MDRDTLQQLLQSLVEGNSSVDEALSRIVHMPYENIDYARIDHHRSLRKGFPEVIFGQGKTAEQISGILGRMLPRENIVLVTRIDEEKAAFVRREVPAARYEKEARMLIWQKGEVAIRGRGTILVLTAGTSDIPVAREAALTAAAMGNRVDTAFDVGVAGIHRLLDHREAIMKAAVLIVVAGMEGALPSVVAGMVDRPVIAVPTSIGYGVSLGGMTALFAMLNSCSSNVAAVNIDNGFGAGYMAAMINRP